MKFQQAFFSGNNLRPVPVIVQDEEMIIVATPWGSDSHEAEDIIEEFIKTYQLFFSDTQATLPFKQMHSLSISENYMRTALLHINRLLFVKNNQEELSLGFEFAVFLKTNSEITVAQIGNPQIYLSRKNIPLQPIHTFSSLSTLYSEKQNLCPLPQDLLGIFSDISISIRSFKYQDDDEFIFLSKDFIPVDFLNSQQKTFDETSQILSQDKEAFWMGKVCLT